MLLIAWNVLCWSFWNTKDKNICTIQYIYRTLACIWLALILKTVCNAVDLISLDSFVTYNVYTPIILNWHVFTLNYFHLLANLNALVKNVALLVKTYQVFYFTYLFYFLWGFAEHSFCFWNKNLLWTFVVLVTFYMLLLEIWEKNV